MDLDLTPTDHLSPPSTTSRLSDSDTSDLEDPRDRRVAELTTTTTKPRTMIPATESCSLVILTQHKEKKNKVQCIYLCTVFDTFLDLELQQLIIWISSTYHRQGQ